MMNDDEITRGIVGIEQRTRRDLIAGQRYFRQNGVRLFTGPRGLCMSAIAPLRTPYAIHAAYHPDTEPQSNVAAFMDVLLDEHFNHVGGVLVGIAAVLIGVAFIREIWHLIFGT